jgi:hypothetical protein
MSTAWALKNGLWPRCRKFMEELAAGEWDDDLIAHDTEKLVVFVLTELESQMVASAPSNPNQVYRVEYDGFVGTEQGSYVTREGKAGVVLQQVGTKVVHVYGRNRIEREQP